LILDLICSPVLFELPILVEYGLTLMRAMAPSPEMKLI
jgi:hypothetical protein